MSDTDFSPIKPTTLAPSTAPAPSGSIGTHDFSPTRGIAQARDIFIEGNALPARFNALLDNQHFVIGETRFGSGLNFLVTATSFLQHAKKNTALHYIAVEERPLALADLKKSLAPYAELETLSAELIEKHPPLTPGFHRQSLFSNRITLTLIFGDTNAMLAQLTARIDAWFLSENLLHSNLAMSRNLLCQHMAQLSHRNTSFSSNSSKKSLQRELQQAGFRITTQASPAPQQPICKGIWVGTAPLNGSQDIEQSKPTTPLRIAIVGAGLAGITTAAALTQRGHNVQVFDRAGVANGASGNLAGVVYTTPSAHPTPQNRFYQSSYLYALKLFNAMQFPRNENDGALTGVLQLAKNKRLADKAYAALDSGLWTPELLGKATVDDTGIEALNAEHFLENSYRKAAPNLDGALVLHQAGYVSAPRWCARLIQQANISVIEKNVTILTRSQNGCWQLTYDDTTTEIFDQVILANAASALTLVSLPTLKLKNIRGQVSYVKKTSASNNWPYAICHAGYLTPAIDDLHCVGATFDIEDNEPEPREDDDRKNIEQLKEYLPQKWRDLGGNDIDVHSRRVGFRCQSTDFLPLVGQLADIDEELKGLWLNIAHGSRGITGTPLCAELLSCLINDEPLPMDKDMRAALAPVRFLLRQEKRNRN